ncbi:MAG: hypothetical protein SCK29_07185 [Bacillota bacterium]|nr:hypothetical protein [Bacillota bacterium]MDW7683883.1 hypothetical protein [Bacillota bacterium]
MKRLTPIKAIRQQCLDCSGGQRAEVRECPVDACTLWPYRMGKNPFIERPAQKGKQVGSKINSAETINAQEGSFLREA